MHWIPRRWTLVGILLAIMLTVSPVAMAQVTTTEIADMVYRADGSTATGTVVISWPEFTTASGQSVPAGSTSVVIATGGALEVQLAPNAGSNPMGSYYTVVYHLDDGSVSRQYWVVPASGTPVKINTISSTVMPLSVAQQTVSKSYVDTAIAQAVTGVTPEDSSSYVLKAGDTMTGPLVLPGDPTGSTQAADKHYVDTSVQQVAAGVGQKVSLLPQTTQTVTQPTGTELNVNKLNDVEYATQYATFLNGNAIANAVTSPDCATGCDVKVGNSYTQAEQYSPSTWNDQTHVKDARSGAQRDSFINPGSQFNPGFSIGQTINLVSTKDSGVANQTVVSEAPSAIALDVSNQALAGGSNLFPQSIEGAVPYFKNSYLVQRLTGTYNTVGQHAVGDETINCFGVGDCLIGQQAILASGGFRDEADEGAHPFDLDFSEDSRVFTGTCSSGCSTGSTSVMIAASSSAGTQGEGRYLINKNPAKIINTGLLTGSIGSGIYPEAVFSGTSFPVSVFFATAQIAPSQANNIAPGTVTLPIATSGVTVGFATNTAAAPSQTGIACIADQDPPGSFTPHNYEMASYTVVDGTHLRMTLNKVHGAGSTVAIGGLCGYGLEQTVDTQNGIRQVFPVIGSLSPSSLYYAGGQTYIVGTTGLTSGYLNVSATIASIVRTNNVVTLTATGNFSQDINGLAMSISNVADSSYNGTFTVTTTGPNTLTYAQTGPNSTSSSGNASMITGQYVLYPIAEVLGVMNPATKLVDGQMTLAPNTVAWAAGDAVEQPHYFQENVAADTTFISQTTPRPAIIEGAGIRFDGTNGPGLIGWKIDNHTPETSYLGAGGTHAPPTAAFQAVGAWHDTMSLEAGQQAVFAISCNYHGCNRWNSGYNLFELDGNQRVDTIGFSPQTNTMTFGFGGATYSFSAQGLSTQTINATTINAGQINGTVSGNSITSGAVAADYLPKLGASGAAHAAGIVPDPGATSGTTRFLREDGSWTVPTGAIAAGGNLLSGATADYNFLQGSGTVLTDSSGNGNNGTLMAGASAPVWTSTGLSFSYNGGTPQGVSLPAALNNTKTMLIVADTADPIAASGGSPEFQFSTLVTSSLGGSGLNFLNQGIGANFQFVSNTFSPNVFAGGSSTTFAPNILSGLHCEAVTFGTGGSDKDHLYIDGNEVASYFNEGSSFGTQSSGNLFIGSPGTGVWANGGFAGTFYRTRFYPTELTADQVSLTCAGMKAEVASRGVSFTPVPVRAAAPQIEGIGDSITYGQGSSTPYLTLLNLTNQPAYTITNWGNPSVTLQAMSGVEPNRVATHCTSSAGLVIASIFAGTNDLTIFDPGAASVMSSLASEILTLKNAGCKVFVMTMISRGGMTQNGVHTVDSQKDAYDALILQQSKLLGADGIIDVAANPLLGADGANSNSTYFNTDLTHPTNAGQTLIAAAYSNTLNYFFGSKAANPTVVTASTYQMLSGDGAVTAAPTANAAYTMPSCIGPSGETYTISNPQSAFALSITGQSGQPINGLATPITIPPNSTVTLRDVPNPKTVSGCHWVM